MSHVALDITMSLDGFVTAPNDGPSRGLGDDGEVLHYWVFCRPWTYDDRPNVEATGVDKQVLVDAMESGGAAVVGRRSSAPDVRCSVSSGCLSISSAHESASRHTRRTWTSASRGDSPCRT